MAEAVRERPKNKKKNKKKKKTSSISESISTNKNDLVEEISNNTEAGSFDGDTSIKETKSKNLVEFAGAESNKTIDESECNKNRLEEIKNQEKEDESEATDTTFKSTIDVIDNAVEPKGDMRSNENKSEHKGDIRSDDNAVEHKGDIRSDDNAVEYKEDTRSNVEMEIGITSLQIQKETIDDESINKEEYPKDSHVYKDCINELKEMSSESNIISVDSEATVEFSDIDVSAEHPIESASANKLLESTQSVPIGVTRDVQKEEPIESTATIATELIKEAAPPVEIIKTIEIAPSAPPPSLTSLEAQNLHRTQFMLNQQEDTFQAFTEDQLAMFYFNQELMQIDFFVDEFLKNSNKEYHDFYEMVQAYYKARKRYVDVTQKIKDLQAKCSETQNKVWVIEKRTIKAKGVCGHGVSVEQEHMYQQAHFNKDSCTCLSSHLTTLRGMVNETLQLEYYNSHVTKIQIDDYIGQLFKPSKKLRKLKPDSPISALVPNDVSPDHISFLCAIQECISVLFVYKRMVKLEEKFQQDLDSWLNLLVAALQRFGTLPDSFFLLNHLLRCPPNTVSIMAHYLQFPSFTNQNSFLPIFDRPQLHHFVVMLATITLPVKARKEFLSKIKPGVLQRDYDRSISWTLVDESKEESEKQEDDWSLLTEVDLISLFEQFPFDDLLKSILFIKTEQDNDLVYTPSNATSNDMMRTIAFFSCLINLLGKIFETYTLIRYRRFIQCVSCNIRIVVQIISDHWLAYRQHRQHILGEHFHALPIESKQVLPQFSLKRLQIEFDQFFLRAVKKILSSQSSGAIQFLSIMPFDALSSESIWVLLDLVLNRNQTPSDDNALPSIKSTDVSPSDGIFLLTALSNMAINRDNSDQLFIETVTIKILDISFLNESLSELYEKNGHDLLVSISNEHPFVISTLLKHVIKNVILIEKDVLYIFEDLAVDKWRPTTHDIECIRKWLLESSLTSAKNQLARLLLAKLNYGQNEIEHSLFLPRNFHYICAIMIVEAYGSFFPDYPGGIQRLDYAGLGLLGQVSQIAVSSYNKIMYSRVHAEFSSWAWGVMLTLKLHQCDNVMNETTAEVEEIVIEGSLDTWTVKALAQLNNKYPYDFDVDLTPELLNVGIALQSKGLLAGYVAFAMTKHGHFVDVFLDKGMMHLQLLADNYNYNAVLRIINNATPLFLNCPDKLTNESFLKLLLTVVHIDVDNAGYTEKLWQYFVAGTYSQKFASLITTQILKSKKANEFQAEKMVRFWLMILIKLPYWSRDCGVLYQIDNLCKVAYTLTTGLNLVQDILYEEFKQLIQSQEKKGLLSSVMSWISAANQIISLMPTPTSDFCYFAYVILCVESKFEEDIGLWKELSAELIMNANATLDQSYKKSLNNLKSVYIPPLYELSIYRWSAQAMVTPNDHPFLPIIWHHFFFMYLRKHQQESGVSSRRGIGNKLFDSSTTVSISKKMKTTLYALASYHQERSVTKDSSSSVLSEWSLNEKEHVYNEEFHGIISKLYQGFALWLEESRLHDPNLYLSSLPEAYNPMLLERIFQGNQCIWTEYVEYETFLKEIDTISKIWSHAYFKPIKAHSSDDKEINSHSNAGRRIAKRLQREVKPLLAPSLYIPKSPVIEINYHVLLTLPRLLQDINHDLERIVQYAKSASSLYASHVGLDSELIELLPDLYENVNRQIVVGIPCDGYHKGRRRRHDGTCPSPAQVSLEFKELLLKERIASILSENRTVFESMLLVSTQSITEELCIGTVHVGNIISKLAEGFHHFNEIQRQELQGSARRLFYLLAQLIDDDVKRCHPAIQFFSSSVEKLGKNFIADNSTEQVPLIDAILNQEASVMFLAPHFTPMNSLDHFVELYSKVASLLTHEKPTTVFVLLSKFDLKMWLRTKPTLQEMNDIASLIMQALRKIGRIPDSEGLVILEIYRSHMALILLKNPSEFFGKILLQLLIGSSERCISPLCWDDLLNSIEYDVDNENDPLTYNIVKDTLEYMGSFYLNNVDQLGFQLDPFYEAWEDYAKSMNKLLLRLFYSYIKHNINLMNDYNKDQMLRELWETILIPYRPWLLPRTPGKIWTLLRSESVLCMVQSLTEVLRIVINALSAEQKYCVFMNYLWCFYFESIVPVVREEQSLEIFHSMLATLPWSLFCPTVQDLSYVLQSHGNYPSAFRFLGSLLSDIDWSSVVSSYISSGNHSAVSRLHQQLFSIFVLMAANKHILSASSSKLTYLFTEAKTFHWETLGLEDIARSCKWYAENVESALILDKESIIWVTLNLFLNVCGFIGETQSNDVLIAKRNIYVQTIVTLLTRCSSSKRQVQNMHFVLQNLFSTIEKTIVLNDKEPMRELIMHSSTCLNLLNMLSNAVVSDIVKSTFESHLFNTRCSMLIQAMLTAASRSLANIQEMIWFLESCIKCHFVRLADDELPNSWLPIYNSFIPPELNKEDFVKEAIKQKAVLTLYSYNLHRIPLSPDVNELLEVLSETVQWCTKILPDNATESKILLLWLQIFDLIRLQVTTTSTTNHIQQVSKYMIFLAHACQICGEDKTYSGVLGAIGIGRRSILSKEFRFSAKALHLFLLCQMPTSGSSLRISVDAPGSIRQNKNDRIKATTDAEKAYTNFQSLSKVKPYNTMIDENKWILEFISNPQMNILNGCSLVAYLCKKFFDKENFIAASIV